MTRIFGFHLSLEMLVLWLIESTICFFLLTWLMADGAPLADAATVNVLDSAAILALTIGLVSCALGLYRPESCLETRRLLIKAAVAAAVSLPAIWLVGKAVNLNLGALFGWDRIWPAKMLIAWTGVLLATRLLFTLVVRAGLLSRRVLLLGHEMDTARTAEAIANLRRGQFRVVGTQRALSARDAPSGLWAVIVGRGAASAMGEAELREWRSRGVRVLNEAAFWERHLGRVDPASPALDGEAGRANPATELASRGLDIVAASLLLAFTAPLMLVTALLIKLESRGPVFYEQERVGLHGRTFTVRKFRSMRVDAEANGPVWAVAGDARVTRVGAYIRLLRIDELPQLLTVLRGDMSLIGPRPERPHFVGQLSAVIPGYCERTRVKPGLTGWAQVNFPYGASVEDARAKLSYDLYYVKHRTFFLDLLILMATVRVVLFQEGAR